MHIVNLMSLSFVGRPGPQVGVHHFLSRRPAEEQGEEDLRGVCYCCFTLEQADLTAGVSGFDGPLLCLTRFRASLYPCPETPQERKEMLAGVNSRIDDLQMVSPG